MYKKFTVNLKRSLCVPRQFSVGNRHLFVGLALWSSSKPGTVEMSANKCSFSSPFLERHFCFMALLSHIPPLYTSPPNNVYFFVVLQLYRVWFVLPAMASPGSAVCRAMDHTVLSSEIPTQGTAHL